MVIAELLLYLSLIMTLFKSHKQLSKTNHKAFMKVWKLKGLLKWIQGVSVWILKLTSKLTIATI